MNKKKGVKCWELPLFPILDPLFVNWQKFVNDKENEIDLKNIRNSIERQAPLGEINWKQRIASEYGIESTLNPRGRPWNKEK